MRAAKLTSRLNDLTARRAAATTGAETSASVGVTVVRGRGASAEATASASTAKAAAGSTTAKATAGTATGAAAATTSAATTATGTIGTIGAISTCAATATTATGCAILLTTEQLIGTTDRTATCRNGHAAIWATATAAVVIATGIKGAVNDQRRRGGGHGHGLRGRVFQA